MNDRQRFLSALSFGKPDRLPFEPGWPRQSTLRTWHAQGLPGKGFWYAHMMEALGLAYQAPGERPEPEIDFRLLPQFEEKILSHQAGHLIVQDWMGAVTEISDEFDATYLRQAKDFVTRKWHSFPVQKPQDWQEKIQWRYRADDPRRFPNDYAHRLQCWQAEPPGRDYPLKISFNGPFWQLREWCGFEGLCTWMAEDPAFVAEMSTFWCDFIQQMLKRILQSVTPDFILVNEDMAYKQHSMISPRMVERFLLPAWAAWIATLKEAGVPLIFIDSDGYVAELLPLWVEAGFNGTYPLEVAAGNDICAYRRQYGRSLAFLGGIDKRALAAGGEIMRAEVLRVVPPLLEEGGFIPGCDHGIPPDISWPDFLDYARLLASLTGWEPASSCS